MTHAGSGEFPSDEAQALLVMIMGVAQTSVLRAAAQLEIADHLTDGPRSVEKLADATATDPVTMGRLLDFLVHLGVCVETAPGEFGCTAMGRLLRTVEPGSLRHTAMLMGEEALLRAWSGLPDSVRTGTSAFGQVLGTDPYSYAQQQPALLSVFQQAMSDQSQQEAGAIAEAYDFSGFSLAVDVGGGRGGLLAGLLQSVPDLRAVLFDLPAIVAGAGATFDTDTLRGRCRLVGGDYLTSVPVGRLSRALWELRWRSPA